MKIFKNIFLAALALIGFSSCQSADGNQTGSEMIPDMAHPVAYDANIHGEYSLHTFNNELSGKTRRELVAARLPVEGTLPRGAAGAPTSTGDNGIKIPENGSVPYYYRDTEEERTRAMAEIINNPFPITDAGLVQGKELYEIFCGICHGNKGDGNGYLVDEKNPNQVYPAAPANFLLDEHVTASNGRYYHAIMYGKNVMGGYADKLSYEERWNVIHYVRSLQAKEKKLAYNQEVNTLNSGASPAGAMVKETSPMTVVEESHDDEHHGDDHDHGTH